VTTEALFLSRPRRCALLSAVVIAAAATGAAAQLGPPGPPPGGGPPAVGPVIQELVLTPAQKLVAALPAPHGGGLFPLKPLPPDGPLPSPDPRDLQGAWSHNQALEPRIQKDMYGAPIPYTMAGAQVLLRRVISSENGKPFTNASAKCRPPGPQWQRDLNFPFQIFQSKSWIEFVFEEFHGRWQILLDPSRSPPSAQKRYMGRSIGRWDGNTLVVTSSDFKQALWLDVDGTPLSADGKLIQRIRKVDYGNRKPYLEVVTTVVDPLYYTDPWSFVRTFSWQPDDAHFREYNCEEQVGDPTVDADAGLVPEPKD
jgi:hypothetical protein